MLNVSYYVQIQLAHAYAQKTRERERQLAENGCSVTAEGKKKKRERKENPTKNILNIFSSNISLTIGPFIMPQEKQRCEGIFFQFDTSRQKFNLIIWSGIRDRGRREGAILSLFFTPLDQTFHYLGALKSKNRRFWTTYNLSIDCFWD